MLGLRTTSTAGGPALEMLARAGDPKAVRFSSRLFTKAGTGLLIFFLRLVAVRADFVSRRTSGVRNCASFFKKYIPPVFLFLFARTMLYLQVPLPVPMLHRKDCDLSFAGLKNSFRLAVLKAAATADAERAAEVESRTVKRGSSDCGPPEGGATAAAASLPRVRGGLRVSTYSAQKICAPHFTHFYNEVSIFRATELLFDVGRLVLFVRSSIPNPFRWRT